MLIICPKDGSTTVYDYWDQDFIRLPVRNISLTVVTTLNSEVLLSGAWQLLIRHEKAYKYNVGVDAVLFNGLDVTAEGYYQRRKIFGSLPKENIPMCWA